MRTILALSVVAVLATAVIVPAFHDEAYALKADNSEKLSPKAYGQKTIDVKCGENNCFVKSSAASEHPSKIAKKTWSEQRTEMFMAKYLQTLGLTAP